ncbi:hypothetical protein JMJ35_002719 [Cladonia borealis]|uniref:Purine nucleoside phosphorylase n=1 Tax=Cladonia borealis TaxID=184061 RepID=A0AA39V9F0_9LECA|nr:hypothetical protein JMJ35_002719 [Cladonia borealis]
MSDLPTTYPDPVPLAIIGGTGLSTLPSPPFHPLASLPTSTTTTPWGPPSSAITILSYTPTPSQHQPQSQHAQQQPTIIAFLARHGTAHDIAPHEINNRANVAALKRLGVRCVVGFSAVGSLREEVKPRDFCVGGGVVDWTKGVRPWTFFEKGMVGHISMADPFDKILSESVYKAISRPGVLEGEEVKAHKDCTVIVIEGPQFSTRSESLLYRSLPTNPPISIINMSTMPEAKLFREAEIAYALIAMSTDYDSWHDINEGSGCGAVGGVEEGRGGEGDGGEVERADEGGVLGLAKGHGGEAVERLRWLFGDEWVDGAK